jgi:hypothetical protein
VYTIYRADVNADMVRAVAQRSGVADRNSVLFLDDQLNTVRADLARASHQKLTSAPGTDQSWKLRN